MSKKAAFAAAAPSPALPPEEEKPLVLVGLESTPKGYVVVSATIRGERVESLKRHGPPQLKEWSARELKKVMLAKVLFPKGF